MLFALVIPLVLFPDSLQGRLLNSRAAVKVGVLSYSIYLFYELAIEVAEILGPENRWVRFILSSGLLAVLSLTSSAIAEQPFAAIRRKYAPRPKALNPGRDS
jgi:peptidoglycan/LPS O-acetylase OafA/YrhL